MAGSHSQPEEMWTEEYQVEFLRRYLDVAASRPFVAGLHVWNFADTPELVSRRLEQCQRALDELVTRDKNHPSVIM